MNFLYLFETAIGQGLIWALLAIGVYITFKILDIPDLTVDGSLTTGGAVATILIINGVHPILAMMIAFIAGCLAGGITGSLHLFFGIPAILSGILTQMMLYTINLFIMGGKANLSIPLNTNIVEIFTVSNIWPTIGISAFIVIAFIVILHFFFNTEIGYSLVSVGCNAQMARAQGINVKVYKLLGLMLSNGLVALSGALFAKFQGFIDIGTGRGAIIIGLAAIVIGQGIFCKLPNKLFVQLTGITIGSFIYYFINSIILALDLSTELMKLLAAILIAFVLGVPYWKKKLQERSAGRPPKEKKIREKRPKKEIEIVPDVLEVNAIDNENLAKSEIDKAEGQSNVG